MQYLVNRSPRRPAGVSIVSIVTAIAGIFVFSIGGVAFWIALFDSMLLEPAFSATLVAAAGITGLVVGLATLIFAWGLWTLKRWALWRES